MLSSSIQESSFTSTTSKQIQTILPYGKHQKGVDFETIKKPQQDVSDQSIYRTFVIKPIF